LTPSLIPPRHPPYFIPLSERRGNLKEEDRKDEVTKVNEEEVIRMMMRRTEEKSIRRR
jgi:hypothetical protein